MKILIFKIKTNVEQWIKHPTKLEVTVKQNKRSKTWFMAADQIREPFRRGSDILMSTTYFWYISVQQQWSRTKHDSAREKRKSPCLTKKQRSNFSTYGCKFLQAFSGLTIFFSQPWDELLWGDDSHLFFLRSDAVEEVCQTGEQAFFAPWLDLIGQHFLPEGPAEVQGLQYRVTIAGVAELKGGKIQEEEKKREIKKRWYTLQHEIKTFYGMVFPSRK